MSSANAYCSLHGVRAMGQRYVDGVFLNVMHCRRESSVHDVTRLVQHCFLLGAQPASTVWLSTASTKCCQGLYSPHVACAVGTACQAAWPFKAYV
jgi:hypothetical protein